MADPEFPTGGAPIPRGGANIPFDQFFQKTAWKWKQNLAKRGRASLASPLDPPLIKSSKQSSSISSSLIKRYRGTICTKEKELHVGCMCVQVIVKLVMFTVMLKWRMKRRRSLKNKERHVLVTSVSCKDIDFACMFKQLICVWMHANEWKQPSCWFEKSTNSLILL